MTARRTRLIDEMSMASRRYLAAYVLFNQAIADHLGLHPTDVQALSLLTAEQRPVTVKELAGLTGLTTGSATRLVDRLERGGYVTRTPDEHDRRRVLVTLVPAALAPVAAIWDDLGAGWQSLLDGHSDAELETITEHLRRAHDLSQAQMERLRSRPRPS